MALGFNFASKYSDKVDEAFTLGAMSTGAVNQDFDWVGVDTINVYSIPTVDMNDYKMYGMSRYGDPDELKNDIQTMKLVQDRSFTFTIDRKNNDDTMFVMDAAKALRRQIEQVIIPEVDTYRFVKICAGAGTLSTAVAVTKSNAYEEFLKIQEALDEKKAPQGGRICYATPAYINKIKQDSAFTKSGDLSQNMLIANQYGDIDGVPVVKLPSFYLPSNVDFIITNSIATVAPVKLETYKLHENVPGIDGVLCEGRVRYDTFVLKNKKNAIGVHINTGSTVATKTVAGAGTVLTDPSKA